MTDCYLNDCGRPVRAGGLCSRHYTQHQETGFPPKKPRPAAAPISCRVEGCADKVKYRGKRLCMKHYLRIWKHGSTDLPAKPTPREMIEQASQPDDAGCWIWQGATSTTGYGRLGGEYAHRVAYSEYVGPIPDGLTIDHLCRNKACVNPEHLEAVPLAVNILRSDSPSARNARRTLCIRGHEFTPEFTYTPPRGGRQCRACARIRERSAS